MKNHINPWRWACGILLLSGMVTGCSTIQIFQPQTRARNEGYSLLYDLVSQESDVAKLLVIKHTEPPVTDAIKEIAETCSRAKIQLDAFHKKDHQLSFTMSNLPSIEQQTRTSIAATDTKELLFSSGKLFEHRLLFTQAQAMNYAAHLAQVLQEKETEPSRKDFLVKLAERCTTLHDKVIKLMQ